MTSAERRPSIQDDHSLGLLGKAVRSTAKRTSSFSSAVRALLSSTPSSAAPSRAGSGATTPQQPTSRAQSIAPPNHRENTALHALIDSLPTLPSFHAPSLSSLPSVKVPSFSFGGSAAKGGSGSEDDEAEPGVAVGGVAATAVLNNDPLKRLGGPVVTLGGYRGSILRDAKTNKRIWIPMKVGFRVRKVDLALGLDDEDEERATDTIVAGRQLMQVGPIDLGKRLKDKLKGLAANPPSPPPAVPLSFVNFGYDWRLSLHLSSANLLAQLEQLKADSAARGEGDGKGVGSTVIAHSMGGLVTLHALARARDPTVFKGIIFCGVPFGGCVNVLSPLRNGDGVMFARDICSPSVVFSMRSSYYFLPLDGRCFETPEGTPIPIDLYDPHSYSDYNLSPVTKGLYREKGFVRDEERREGMEEASEVQSPGGAAGFGEGNLGEAGARSKGIEETLARDKSINRPASPPEELETIPHDEAEGEVEVVGLSPPQSRRPSANDDAGVKMDREGSADSADQPRRSDEEEAPAMPELDKVLSASDQTIARYLARTLHRVKQFHRDLEELYDPAKAAAGLYPPMALLTSRKTPTVRGVIAKDRASIKTDPYEDLLWDEGDGIVLYASSSSLPGGPDRWNKHVKGIVESNHGHVSLVGDVNSVRQCLVKLYDE